MLLKPVLACAAALLILSCHSATQSTASVNYTTGKKLATAAPRNPTDIKYIFHYRVVNSQTAPNDDLFIDSNRQMTFTTFQQMRSGQFKTPTGFAYLEPSDDDTLYYFMRQDALFDIDPSDVKPQCPTGDVLIFAMYRCDLKKWLKLETNTCASDFNLLSGAQRKLFQQFIPFVQRLAMRYRPGFMDN